jgi:hypothetical protein
MVNPMGRLLRRCLKPFLVLVALTAIGTIWHWWINIDPSVVIPTPKMPRPNAYDYYISARKAVVDAKLVDWAISEKPTARPGLTGRYVTKPGAKPIGVPGSDMPIAPSTYVPPPKTVATLAEKEALLAHNQQALALVRCGFHYECVVPPVRSWEQWLAKQGFGTAARLLILDGQVKQGHKDWLGATRRYMDRVKIGCDYVRGNDVGAVQPAAAAQSRGRKAIWKVVNHLDAAGSRAAARRMESIAQGMESYWQILTESKQEEQALILEWMKQPVFRSQLAQLFDLLDGQNHTAEKIRSRMVSKRAIMATYSDTMEKLIAESRRPYATTIRSHAQMTDFFYHWIGLDDYGGITNIIHRRRWESARARNGLLAVALALRAYKLEHGRYPATLNDLVPSYLTKLPDDPFALNGSLHFRRSGSSYVLYSLGPDCVDNGGKPLDKHGKGDLVAGIEPRY